MVSLARRNLFHDKLRLAVTLTGIIFAIILIVVQLGLFFGLTATTSGVIDNSGVEIWVTPHGVPFLEVGAPFAERKLYELLSVAGVANAKKMIIRLINWKRPVDGEQQGIVIVGFDPSTRYGGPWNIVDGDPHGLAAPDTVFIDELYKPKLGISRAGDIGEVNGRRARVVGFTKRIRSFSTTPYVFTSFKNAVRYTGVGDDQAQYVLVKTDAGADVARVKAAIAARVDGVDVYTTAEMSRRIQIYWMFTTGAGVGILIAAVMGLVVGVVVVAQTIYATVMDHIREFGTLKAIGASNRYLYRVLIRQAVLSAVIGYAVGIIACYVIVWVARDAAVPMLLPWQLAVGMFVLTVVMCVSAALLSINRVTRIEPGMVFK
jgi:putative ABC transport system permease protein